MATSPSPNTDEGRPPPRRGRRHPSPRRRQRRPSRPSRRPSAAAAVRTSRRLASPRVEALSASISRRTVFASFRRLPPAYAYGLDGTLRYAYQPVASASFGVHSLQATINVVRAVIAAAAQPVSAKIADVFGRVEPFAWPSSFTFVIYQIGYTMIILLVEVIIADISSTRARLFFSYIPALPFIINTWVSGNISEAVLAATTWRWGVAMWCIIFPLCAMPLILSLGVVARRAHKEGRLTNYRSSFEILGFRSLTLELFWLLDVIVVGVLCIPVFVLWELKAPPAGALFLIKDRSVWAPRHRHLPQLRLHHAIRLSSPCCRSPLTFPSRPPPASSPLPSPVSLSDLLGLVVFKVRRLKIFVVVGTALYMVAFGLLIHYRGSTSGSGRAGVIGAQVLLGVAGGMFPYTAQASLQVGLKHENLAVMTGIYLAMYNVGSALGNTVSGAMWSQLLPAKLDETLADLNSTLAAAAYADPFTNVVAAYPVAHPLHHGRLPLRALIFAAMLRNPKLSNEQTLAKDSASETGMSTLSALESACDSLDMGYTMHWICSGASCATPRLTSAIFADMG
ncbi:siderophore iron transporter [Hirsutella rhossiliensis]|uniref:Siderophore iron transporter n=1 Tax=Hirsutella rhossiliensis TaxID=111463 RepID=A0A9P8SD42_9HYPO|nr:siderophore iron transporter [Hirsutella rhossiliensis]KAH0956945.1 siderophore iron transporter [Hirsutella rhossiliensis]